MNAVPDCYADMPQVQCKLLILHV